MAWIAIVYMLVGAAHQQVTVREQQATCVGMLIGACLSGIMVSKLSVHLAELNAEKVRLHDGYTTLHAGYMMV